MSERAKYRGILAETEDEIRKIENRMKGLVGAMRDQLNPFEDLGDLKTEVIAEQAMELASQRIELVEKRDRAKALKKHLGMR